MKCNANGDTYTGAGHSTSNIADIRGTIDPENNGEKSSPADVCSSTGPKMLRKRGQGISIFLPLAEKPEMAIQAANLNGSKMATEIEGDEERVGFADI